MKGTTRGHPLRDYGCVLGSVLERHRQTRAKEELEETPNKHIKKATGGNFDYTRIRGTRRAKATMLPV